MLIQLNCPHCRTALRIPDALRGKKVRCKSCTETFSVPGGGDDAPVLEEERTQPTPRPRAAAGTRRRRDDDEDDAPRRRRREPAQAAGGGSLALIFGIVGAVALLGVTAVAVAVLFMDGGSTPPKPPVAVGVMPNFQEVPEDPEAFGGNPFPPGGPAPGPAGDSLRYQWRNGPHVYSVRVEVEREDHVEVHQGTCVVRATPQRNQPVFGGVRRGTGTGFVVRADGHLITCAHVVADAKQLDVAIGGRSYPATVLAVDPTNDVALIKIDAQNLPTLPLANSDAAEVGLEVRALGYPLSSVLGDNIKATRGTISGINNQNGRRVFQVDASINPGNSGGPLVNEAGEVLGVNSAKLAGEAISNVGFVAPVNEAKRLLKDKGVSFTAARGGARLEGTALVKQVTPAVALITVVAGPGTAAEAFRLTGTTSLGRSTRPKPGVLGGMPQMPAFGGFPQPAQIDVDAQGGVATVSGGTQLPMLLGEAAVYLLDPLPPDGRQQWEVSGTCTLEESAGQDRFPFGPRMGPRPGFGRPRFPGMPGNQEGKSRQAAEKSEYRRGEKFGDVLVIHKTYQMTAPRTGESPAILLHGDGKVGFDTKLGVPRAIDFTGKFVLTRANASNTYPIEVSYKLVEGAEREKILNPPAAPPPPAKEVTPADLPGLLAQLKDANQFTVREALGQLKAAKVVADKRDEVAKAMHPLLEVKDVHTRGAVLEALAVWGTKDTVPLVIALLPDAWPFTRFAAMKTLGALKDERAIEPIAKRFAVLQDRGSAREALTAFGAKAEKPMAALLAHEDVFIRAAACTFLGEVGTTASLPALKKAAGDTNGLVQLEAKKAIDAIGKRK